MLRSLTCRYFPVVALATVLLAHVSAFAGMLLTPALARPRRVRDVTPKI
jgi:hypothetical protein